MNNIKKKYFNHYSSNKFYIYLHILVFRIFKSRLSFFSKINLHNKKILDLGCGKSDNFNFFKKLKMKYFGVDIDKGIINNLNKIFNTKNFYLGNNELIPFKNNYFDFILSIHSFYYLDNKNSEIENHKKEILRVLKKGGYIILTLPKNKLNHYRFNKLKKNKSYRISHDKFNLRNNTFMYKFSNKQQISNFFKKDFKIIDIGFMDYSIINLSEYHWWCVLKKK